MAVSVSATNSTCLHLKLKQVRLYIINRQNGSQAVLLHCQRQHRGHSLLRLLPCRLLKLRLLVCNIVSCFFAVFGISRDTIHTHTHLTALFLGLPRWAGTRKVKPIWILLKQEIMSGSGISWAICKSAPHSRQITMPAPRHSVFYRPDALPAAQPSVSKHWRLEIRYEMLF